MKILIVSVRDRAADTFGRPFFATARGQAIRAFTDEINRRADDNQLYNHPEDFDLYEVGTFDDDFGIVQGLDQSVMICVGKDVSTKDK